MGYVALQMLSSFSSEAPTDFPDAYISTDATVHTDGLKAFNLFGEGSGSDGHANATQPFLTVNTLIAKSQHLPKATYRAFSLKHLPTISAPSGGTPTVATTCAVWSMPSAEPSQPLPASPVELSTHGGSVG
jgi:hypothetical protein